MLVQKPCQQANWVSGAPCKVFSMFSEALSKPAHQLLVVLFVPTQQMFSGSVVRTEFIVKSTAGIVLLCYSAFCDTSKLFGPSVIVEVPLVYCCTLFLVKVSTLYRAYSLSVPTYCLILAVFGQYFK